MLFGDTYKTISHSAEGTFRDRGSKFIGYAFPVNSEDDVKVMIQQIKAEHTKARHHCWALRLTSDRSVFRLNDDGEPSGTAGRPILNTLLSYNVTNILVVVVRYFGGTLLGVPGLINAYKTATIEALNAANIVDRTVNDIYNIRFDYLQMNRVMHIIKEEVITIRAQNFDNNCSMEISIRKMQVNQTIKKFEIIDNVVIKYLFTE